MIEEIALEKAESVGVEHEYTDLKVSEISVVDRPANQKEFAVIKCVDSDTEQKGVEPMADQVAKSTKEAANVEVVVVPVEVAKSDDDTAMEQALENLDTISKSIAALTAKVEGEEGGGETEETEAEKAKAKETPATVFAAALKASGAKPEAIAAAVKKYEKVCACGSATVQKAETKPEGAETETTEGDDDFMGNLAAAVTKAKVLTPKRLAALKALQEQLAKMIGEMEGIPHSKSPKTKVPKDTKFGASGLSSITKSLETVSAAMKTLTNRITKIEDVRQGSKGLGESGTVTTKKADGNLWEGVL